MGIDTDKITELVKSFTQTSANSQLDAFSRILAAHIVQKALEDLGSSIRSAGNVVGTCINSPPNDLGET